MSVFDIFQRFSAKRKWYCDT